VLERSISGGRREQLRDRPGSGGPVAPPLECCVHTSSAVIRWSQRFIVASLGQSPLIHVDQSECELSRFSAPPARHTNTASRRATRTGSSRRIPKPWRKRLDVASTSSDKAVHA
jgi:hypothetical protein